MLNRTLGAMLCLFLLGSVAVAQVQTIKLKNGRSLTGTVKKTDEGYEVTQKGGISVVVKNADVESIEDALTPEDEYLAKLRKIDPNNADERFELGEWAFRKGLYRIAESELLAAKKLRKNFEKADLLLKQVQAQLKGSSSVSSITQETASPISSKPIKAKDRFLSDRDINRIRLSEVQEDEKLRVGYHKKALDRFIKSMASSDDFRDDPDFEKKFRRMDSDLQLDYILSHLDQGAWSLKDDIILRSDPKVLLQFRKKIWPMIRQGCASSNCHGAPEGKGSLKLFSLSSANDAAVYTNFFLLDSSAKGGNKMIYRDHPDLSLLLDYGLPREDARSKHPAKISPIYKSVNDPKYKIVKDWIDSLQGPPDPKYGVEYKPPHLREKKPTTKPAETAETTKPAAANGVTK